jgi:hypothetical protein
MTSPGTPPATSWRHTKPTTGAVGRLVLKNSDPAAIIPVKVDGVQGVDTPLVCVSVLGASDWISWFALDDWNFLVEQPPLPTAPGSSIWSDHGGRRQPLVLDSDGNWIGRVELLSPSDILAWDVIHDTGADK